MEPGTLRRLHTSAGFSRFSVLFRALAKSIIEPNQSSILFSARHGLFSPNHFPDLNPADNTSRLCCSSAFKAQ